VFARRPSVHHVSVNKQIAAEGVPIFQPGEYRVQPEGQQAETVE